MKIHHRLILSAIVQAIGYSMLAYNWGWFMFAPIFTIHFGVNLAKGERNGKTMPNVQQSTWTY